jgi:hypothetical protein
MAVLLLGLMVLARAVARDQGARRDEPRNPREQRAERYALRSENVKVVRGMMFGRWAEDPKRRYESREAASDGDDDDK